jgi:hypothetical protein
MKRPDTLLIVLLVLTLFLLGARWLVTAESGVKPHTAALNRGSVLPQPDAKVRTFSKSPD